MDRVLDKNSREYDEVKMEVEEPTINAMRTKFCEVLCDQKDAIFVASSSGISNAFKIAKLVCEEINNSKNFKNRAICIDSLCMSAGVALLVNQTIRNNITTSDALRYIYNNRYNIVHLFGVEDCTALERPSRLQVSSPLTFGLKKKALLAYDFNLNGRRELSLISSCMSVGEICRKMVQTTLSEIEARKVYLFHADNPDALKKLYDSFYRTNIEITGQTPFFDQFKECYRIGPACGVFLGYSAFELVYMREPTTMPYGATKHLLDQKDLPLEYSIYGQDLSWFI